MELTDSNAVLGQGLDAAIARLRAVIDRVERGGEEVEPGLALVRLLETIEHVGAILDRNLSPEAGSQAIQHLVHALYPAAQEDRCMPQPPRRISTLGWDYVEIRFVGADSKNNAYERQTMPPR